MDPNIEPWYFRHLACPDCGLPLAIPARLVSCSCGYTRPLSLPLDLRPISPTPRTFTVHLSTSAPRILSNSLVARLRIRIPDRWLSVIRLSSSPRSQPASQTVTPFSISAAAHATRLYPPNISGFATLDSISPRQRLIFSPTRTRFHFKITPSISYSLMR